MVVLVDTIARYLAAVVVHTQRLYYCMVDLYPKLLIIKPQLVLIVIHGNNA